jgi:DNA modification methylase
MKKGMRRYENVKLDKLVPYARNARTHTDEQIKKIQSSIREFGFINPVLIDGEYNIIAGHGRVEAAKAEKMKEVPCLFVEDLTEAQKRAYILADNRLALDAGWDEELLAIEIEELKDLGFNLELTGFDMDELEAFGTFEEDSQGNVEVEDDDFDLDEALDEIEEPNTKRGEIYQLGNHRLMCGDSTIKENVEALVNGNKMDMVFTDPPWNVNYGAVKEGNAQGYKPRTIQNDHMSTEDFKGFMDMAFSCMSAVSKPGCMVYVVMSAQEWGNVMQSLFEADYHWSSTIIWNKDRLVLSRKDYHTKYEPIWYGWKNGAPRLAPLEDRKQSDVWDFERPHRSDDHPTMKPIPLVAHAIQNSSKKNNHVLDLFGGSGTTLLACEMTDRVNYSMELDEKYCDVIIRRWEEYTGQKAVLLNPEK